MTRLLRRIHYLLNRERLARELENEMEFHREMCARDGESPGGVRFGSSLRLQEESRDAWGWTWIDRTLIDVKYALRTMSRSPGFTLASIGMLAIGIGVNAASFGFFNLVCFRPMPVHEPDTLVRLQRIAPGQFSTDLPYPVMDFYREHSRTVRAVLALDFAQLLSEKSDRPVRAYFVTENFFEELGAQPALGRLLTARGKDENKSASEPVVVLGYGYWKSQFSGDPGVTGRTIRLNGKPVSVIGVVGKEFSGLTLSVPDVWMPLTQQPYMIAGSELLTSYSAENDGVDVWGRLARGATVQGATDELHALAHELRKLRPLNIWDKESVRILPGGYAQNAGGRSRSSLPDPTLQQKMYPVFALIGALSLLILVVTCGNVGSLLLARGAARQREIWVRTAVGAGKARVVRQLLTESLVLSMLGAGVAVVLGTVMLKQLLIWSDAPAWLDVNPDVRVYAFTLGIAVVAALLFGLTPALQVVWSVKRGMLGRQILVGMQVAGSCVLLVTSGLLVRATQEAMSGTPGFEYETVISIDPRLSFHGYSETDARLYMDRLRASLDQLPGVASVSTAVSPPLGGKTTIMGGEKDGKQFPIYVNAVDPEFFNTVKVRVLRGRNLRAGETTSVLVSETLARRLWPLGEPLNSVFQSGDRKYVVVGVVENARLNALEDDDPAAVYLTIRDGDLRHASFLVRVRSGSTDTLLPMLVRVARTVDSRGMPSIMTLSSAYARKVEPTQRGAIAVSVLGIVALGIGCLGIIGLVAFNVSQRVKEIGIRMALGAKPVDVLGVVGRQFWRPITAGLMLGILVAAGLSQLLRGKFYGLSPNDPAAWVCGTLLLAAASAFAVFVPARRAMRIDPAVALRYD